MTNHPLLRQTPRAYIQLPFAVLITEGEDFARHAYAQDGYEITICRPMTSKAMKINEQAKEYTINGIPAFQADILVIDFHKTTFERDENGPLDPPESLVRSTINSFLTRLRSVTDSFQVDTINFPKVTWEIKYLNDDGSELEKDARLIRYRGTREGYFSWTGMNKEVWEHVNNLPPDYIIPQWQDLILDAYAAFPKIGPAVVLAFTALEVFITQVLDRLVERSNIAPELWKWINDRGNDPEKCPSTEEQYDVLLGILTGKSLKGEQALWEGYKRLRKARNSFVHEGIAIRLQDKKPLTEEDGKILVDVAWKIISHIKSNILGEPESKPKISVSHTFKTQIRGVDNI